MWGVDRVKLVAEPKKVPKKKTTPDFNIFLLMISININTLI